MDGRQESLAWDSHRELWQDVRNSRPIPRPDQQVRAPEPIEVTAWIYWSRDGLELVDTLATHWCGRDVLVLLSDPRTRARGVWLAAQDVRRRIR